MDWSFYLPRGNSFRIWTGRKNDEFFANVVAGHPVARAGGLRRHATTSTRPAKSAAELMDTAISRWRPGILNRPWPTFTGAVDAQTTPPRLASAALPSF